MIVPETVLTVARIFGAHSPECGVESVPCAPDCACVAAARTAIQALRIPTQAMLDELRGSHGDCIHDFDTTWGCAIGVMLGEKDPIDYSIRTRTKR